jgi:hypothetical protein
MKAVNLKLTLLDKLISIKDENLLILANIEVNSPVFNTTIAQKEMLKSSEGDVQNGRLFSDKDVNDEEDEWLSK